MQGPPARLEVGTVEIYTTMNLKVKKVLAIIKADGWFLARTRGSHKQFRHPTKKGLVTIAGQPSDDMARGTINSIFRQSQISKEKLP